MNAIEELLEFLIGSPEPRAKNILAKWRDGGWPKEIMRSLYRDNRSLAGLLDRGGEEIKLLPPPNPHDLWTLICHGEGRKFTWSPLQNRWTEDAEYNGGPA